ncbi:phospho-N-acetylmuramoyl-pentapeptide-transferase [Spirochaeta thermophila DSM 6192]|uniref:Phospho-N-acetylmuramoyl-pentapeptide-transferase n=1 Tax=Winmispira thermophila (strain ATCC 49972 / DSM 6192 / RI 19.B1) TaxID=665571 RepID=E0RS55_WINT6|nr:phospho-N-acetylmuramoyl-pentapeptide-transferase [Spirochaeta thermophila]ADN01842.1 phospho-N-acetylmuramoyl-pentapeptide-transferase [Spirochaeta thermophila DSM 6192]
MLKELLYPLVKYFTPFNIFQYITFRAAYAAVTALLISFVLGPMVIDWLRRLKAGEEVREDGPSTHRAKSGTPTMGGTFIIFSILISVLLWQDLRNPYTWIILLSVVGFGLLGFVDDYLKVFKKNRTGLRAGVKFIGQIVLSLLILFFIVRQGNEYTTLLYIPFFKNPVLDLSYWYIPFAVIFIVGYSNAVNLTDGLDGLATGLVIMVGLAVAVFAYLSGRVDFSEYLQIPYLPGSGELAVFATALVGASIGFLWFNAHPAEVMMGDTGSLSLGGTLAVLGILLKKEILLLIVGGVFVVETASVILQVLSYKLRGGKRIFRMAPLHHHFELSGWPESKVVIRMWILGGLFAIIGLSTLKIQ